MHPTMQHFFFVNKILFYCKIHKYRDAQNIGHIKNTISRAIVIRKLAKTPISIDKDLIAFRQGININQN